VNTNMNRNKKQNKKNCDNLLFNDDNKNDNPKKLRIVSAFGKSNSDNHNNNNIKNDGYINNNNNNNDDIIKENKMNNIPIKQQSTINASKTTKQRKLTKENSNEKN